MYGSVYCWTVDKKTEQDECNKDENTKIYGMSSKDRIRNE